MVVDTLDNIPH